MKVGTQDCMLAGIVDMNQLGFMSITSKCYRLEQKIDYISSDIRLMNALPVNRNKIHNDEIFSVNKYFCSIQVLNLLLIS